MIEDSWVPDDVFDRLSAAAKTAQESAKIMFDRIDGPEHLNGVKWHEAPLPRRFHFCQTQSRKWTGLFLQIERCARGASRIGGRGGWMEKNSRRRG